MKKNLETSFTGFVSSKINEGVLAPNLIQQLTDDGFKLLFYDENINEVPINQATRMSLIRVTNYDFVEKYDIKLPKKKEVTLDYVMDKMKKNSVFTNLTEYMSKIITDKNLDVYPTSYGVGVFIVFKRNENAHEKVSKLLDDLGLKYYTEISDAGWVFRYKINKTKENLEILSKL